MSSDDKISCVPSTFFQCIIQRCSGTDICTKNDDSTPISIHFVLIQKKSRIFVLGDTEEELQTLQKYLTETYPGIEIGGGAVVETLEESAFDSLVNEINSQTTDVIVSGLAGTRQDRFVLENSSKISAKIWLSLGEHSTLQNEAGIKTSWWGTLLKKNTFKRMVTKYNSEKDG